MPLPSPPVIDISHWQGNPDFARVRAAGVVGVIHKATEGVAYVDPQHRTNLAAARAVGLVTATYHWLKPANAGSAERQIAHYLKTIEPVRGERVIIDYEQDGCTLLDLRNAVEALLADPRGLKVTIYSGHLLKQQLGDTRASWFADNTTLWLAQYTSGVPTWSKATWPRWTMWQYTDKGEVPGVKGHCDCNRFNGDDVALRQWFGPAGAAITDAPVAMPPVAPQQRIVMLDIKVPDDVEIKITLNGEPL